MIERDLPGDAEELLELVATIADRELATRAADAEAAGQFPADAFVVLGRAGVLGLTVPAELGGAGLPHVVHVAVLEEIAARWLAVALGVSVHALACLPVVAHGSEAQRRRWVPRMLAPGTVGAYCLSEPHCGSDAAALRTRAELDGDTYRVTGTKAWVTHAGVADFYTLMVRTGGSGPRGISCLVASGDTPGLTVGAPEDKMALGSSPNAQVHLEDAAVPAADLVGSPGDGFRLALEALDVGRLGIAACAVGLARAAVEEATAYARERQAFGHRIADFQGIQFLLADMDLQVHASRALVEQAARLLDARRPASVPAARAKLLATDAAMRVTTDAVQVLGAVGCTRAHTAERYMREAKILQIVEGTNQIQRLVIARSLLGS